MGSPFRTLGFWIMPAKSIIKLRLLTLAIDLVSVCSLDTPVQRSLISRELTSPLENELEATDALMESFTPANKISYAHSPSSGKVPDRICLEPHATALDNYCPKSGNEQREVEQHRHSKVVIRNYFSKDASRAGGLRGITSLHKDHRRYLEDEMLRSSAHSLDPQSMRTRRIPPPASATHSKGNDEPEGTTGMHQAFPSSESKKRSQHPSDSQKTTKKPKAGTSNEASGSSRKATWEDRRMSRYENPPIDRVNQESKNTSTSTRTQPGLRKLHNSSQMEATYLQDSPDRSSVLTIPQKSTEPNSSRLQKYSGIICSQELGKVELVPPMVATTIEEYHTHRKKVLSGIKLQPRHMRISFFHSATEHLGDLEYKKLKLNKKIFEFIDELHINWSNAKLGKGNNHDISERDVIFKKSAIGFATKTAMYFINLISSMYAPPIFQSKELLQKAQKYAFCILMEKWKALESQEEKIHNEVAVSIARSLLSDITSGKKNKRLTLAWLSTSICMKQIIPCIFDEISYYGGYDIRQNFRVLVTDMALLDGILIQLFDSIKPEWTALLPIEVMLKLPKKTMIEGSTSMRPLIVLDEQNADLVNFPHLGEASASRVNSIGFNIQEKLEAFHLIRDYRNFRGLYVDIPPQFTSEQRKEFIFLTLTNYGEHEIKKLDLGEKEKELISQIEFSLRNRYANVDESLMKEDKAKVDGISYATRATLYHINILNDLYSPSLFPTSEIRQEAQKKAFSMMRGFWLRICIPQQPSQEKNEVQTSEMNFLESDQLAFGAFENIQRTSGRKKRDYWSLAWFSTAYWIRETFPAFYDMICHGGNIHRSLKLLFSDIILHKARKLGIRNSKGEKCPFKLTRPFLLQRPA